MSCGVLFIAVQLLLLAVNVAALAGGPIRGDKIPKIVDLAKSTNRGILLSCNAEIIKLFDAVAEENKERSFSDSLVNGRWRLLWTTEKETLFFAKNGLFGKPVADISQTIDLQESFLNNLIEFEGNRKFSVEGSVQLSSSSSTKNGRRLDFRFQSAVLSIPPLLPQLRLPPVGAGWFENVYVNQRYRLSRDVRGDYLLSERVQQ